MPGAKNKRRKKDEEVASAPSEKKNQKKTPQENQSSSSSSSSSSSPSCSLATPVRAAFNLVKRTPTSIVVDAFPEHLPHESNENGKVSFEGNETHFGEETRVLMLRQQQMYSLQHQLLKMVRVLKQDHRLIQDHLQLTKFNLDSHKRTIR